MKEVISKRTVNTKTFHLGGNRYRTTVMSYPVHYNNNGKWEDIDTTVREKKKWEFTHSVEKGIYRAYFHDSSKDNSHLVGVEFVDEEGKEIWVNLKMKGARPTATLREGSEYRFVECFDGVDVQYLALPERLKENIILNKPVELREFVFTLKCGGARVENREEGLCIIREDTGDVVWNVGKPFMQDKSGNVSYGVRYALGNDGEFDTLSVIVEDEQFLSTAEYPIYVDPTIETTNDIGLKSAYTYSTQWGNPNVNYSRTPNWSLGQGSTSASTVSGTIYVYYDAFKTLVDKNYEINKAEYEIYLERANIAYTAGYSLNA